MTESVFDYSLRLIATPIKTANRILLPNDIFTHMKPKLSEALSMSLDLENEIWVVSESHKSVDKTENSIVCFFKHHPNLLEEVNRLNESFLFRFRISIVSDFAQIGFSLSPQDLKVLEELKLPIEISIFSWGNCVDDRGQGDGSIVP